MTSPVLICFAGDRWEGNPHSRHHLMRRFAGEFEVLFIESLPMRSVAGVDRHELVRVWRKLRGRIGVRTVELHLHVLTPAPIPPVGRWGRTVQLAALAVQIAYARRRLGLRGPAVSWFSVPIAAPLRGRLGERGSVFYYQDRYDQFSHVDAELLRTLVADLATGCDVGIATSEPLARDLRTLGGRTPWTVAHGVDTDRFAGDPSPPPALSGLEPPLVGYVGILDDYLSFGAIRAVAERLDRGTVVLVGAANTDVSALDHPRITRLGFRPYAEIPSYLAAFDCCLLPFELTPLTVAVDPIKLREYLAAGRPVVSTRLPSVEPYADVVTLADGPEAFAGAVLAALSGDAGSPAASARRRDRVAHESWDGVADRIRPLLRALADGTPLPQPGS